MHLFKTISLVQVIFVGITLLTLAAIIFMYLRKAGIQLMYLRKKKGKKPGRPADFLRFSFSNARERKARWEAFLMFPMLYPIALDDKDESLNNYKLKVKRLHIGIYMMLIFLVVLAIMSEKVFPA